MAHFEGTIIITDPCYVSVDNDLNAKNGFDLTSKSAPRRFFKTFMIDDTVWGNGKWELIDKNTKQLVGSYMTESGYTGVFYEKDILAYNPNFYKTASKNSYVKLDFTGDIFNHVNEDLAVRVWESKGNVNFISK